MSNARNLADVISGNYDVPAGSLDNVDLSSRVAKTGDTMTGNLEVNGFVQGNAGVVLNNTNRHYLYNVGVGQIGVRFNDGATALGYMWLKDFGGSTRGMGVSSGHLAFATASTERMRIDSAGRVTMPYQPMACSSWTATQSVNNIIGSNAPYIITNVGNHLSGGIFTCPVNGVYRATLTAMTGNANFLNARLRFNGADYWGADTFAAYAPNIQYSRVVISALVVCSASDTLNFHLDNGSSFIHGGYGQISFELVG